MKPGVKPIPIEMAKKMGNPGKRKLPKTPEAPRDFPPPPGHLDVYGLEEWTRIAEGLSIMGVLSSIDQQTLAAYCAAYSRWRLAEEELNKLKASNPLSALVLKTVSGNWIQQPLIGIANTAARDMVRYAAEFGLTPSARARLAIDTVTASSKFDGLIKANGKK